MSRLRALLVCAALFASGRAAAAVPVDVALVLVDDASRSITDEEYALQKRGYASALLDPRVLAAMRAGPHHAVALSYEEFSDDFRAEMLVDWVVIRTDDDARAFVAKLTATTRVILGRTAIGAGIDVGVGALLAAPVIATRRVIDVCGDGQNNSGRAVTEARDDALRQGIVINGLAIANESPNPVIYRHTHPPGGLAHYYEENVTGGDGSFVLEIHDYASFAQAITRKLLAEIAAARQSRQANPRG